MAALEILTVRLNLMKAYGEYIRSLYKDTQDDEGSEVLLEALAIYEHDIERRIAGIDGDFGTLFILNNSGDRGRGTQGLVLQQTPHE